MEIKDFPSDMRKHNRAGPNPPRLTERINLYITPYMRDSIEKLVKKGKFPTISEGVRYMITRYLDDDR